jgi:predicted ester cyclase
VTAELVRRFVTEVWNAEREQTAYEIVDSTCPGLDGTGPDATLAWHRDRRASFPDLRYEIVDLVDGGDTCAVRWRATGTQRGAFGPVPATDRTVTYNGASFIRVAGGRIVDIWSVNELFQLLQQLGVRVDPPA